MGNKNKKVRDPKDEPAIISFVVGEELAELAREWAEQEDLSVSQLLRRLIREEKQRRQKQD